MANEWFQFREFLIRQDRCAMKVGTDGVILGAWTDPGEARRALDVGTGTGLLALMLCQRSEVLSVDAIDIDGNASAQAAENIAASRFSDRIRVRNAAFDPDLAEAGFYELIISNPPYFSEKVFSPDPVRNNARNSSSLPPSLLFSGVNRLLSPSGTFALIIPAVHEEEIQKLAAENSLYPFRKLLVLPAPGKAAKRVCLQFSRQQGVCQSRELLIETGGRHQYSRDYIDLTRDFYLFDKQ